MNCRNCGAPLCLHFIPVPGRIAPWQDWRCHACETDVDQGIAEPKPPVWTATITGGGGWEPITLAGV